MRINRLTLLATTFIIGLPMAALAYGGDHFKNADTIGVVVVDLTEFLAGHDKHFADLDANGDGMIIQDEAKAAFEKFHQEHGDKAGNRFFEEADTDKDGKVSSAESATAEAKRFQQMDANADGFVTQDEAMAAFDKFRAEHPNPEGDHADGDGKPGGHYLFDRVDTDKDGKISKAEWEQGGQKMFAMLDKNADGKLTLDEMKMHHHGGKLLSNNPTGDEAPTP